MYLSVECSMRNRAISLCYFCKNTRSGSGHEETLDEARLSDILWIERLVILSSSRKTRKDGGTQET